MGKKNEEIKDAMKVLKLVMEGKAKNIKENLEKQGVSIKGGNEIPEAVKQAIREGNIPPGFSAIVVDPNGETRLATKEELQKMVKQMDEGHGDMQIVSNKVMDEDEGRTIANKISEAIKEEREIKRIAKEKGVEVTEEDKQAVYKKLTLDRFKEIERIMCEETKRLNETSINVATAMENIEGRLKDFSREELIAYASQVFMCSCDFGSARSMNIQRKLSFGENADFINISEF